MKRFYKFLIIVIILGILGAVYGWFFIYNKPHTDYSTVKPVAILDAESCYNSFVNKEAKTKAWLGQVIEISGKAQSFEKTDSLTTVVFVFNEGMFGDEGIRCSLLPESAEKIKSISFPAEITIKGYCTGYNETDLVIEQCSIINK